ncbi:hypothetical protein FB45DRAFT_911712 [Roridomyces roridus]|uniref:Mitochondrial carrier n=1 Tax=Roridomyces roridus TaxID=1738132 RepID=A0AAD7BVR9_9AGAR|nr:hypothetical protein FB45DRAFT_911712 [Roridomyces roridus]
MATEQSDGTSGSKLSTSQLPDSQGSFQAAVARTATRAAALYFSRPVRLFRPTKVSGWNSLRGLAAQDGVSLTPSYISSLVKSQGFTIIPKHFLPPMVVNALLGTVLWTSYAEASAVLNPHLGTHPTLQAALAGALAGSAQAVVSAPADNVRLLIEGGGNPSWSHAWREVFRGALPRSSASRHETLEEIRKVRSWMREVGDMAGRGWDGFGYTLAKDLTGFALFFAIFDVTRRIALRVKVDASRSVQGRSHVPQFLYGLTLVTGGVMAGISYEVVGRPWDITRQAVRLKQLTKQEYRSPLEVLTQKIRQDGFLSLFRSPTAGDTDGSTRSTGLRRIYSVLRTLARVGPWGVGFLVYQAYDSG